MFSGIQIASETSMHYSIFKQKCPLLQPYLKYHVVEFVAVLKDQDINCIDYKSRKRSGRPKVTSARTDNAIILLARRSPKSSSAKIQSQLPSVISRQTIRRRLFESSLKSCRPAKKPLLTKKNIRDRINFCRKYKEWTADDWEDVFFSDESTFTQFYSFVRHVRRPVGKRHDPKYCVIAVKQ